MSALGFTPENGIGFKSLPPAPFISLVDGGPGAGNVTGVTIYHVAVSMEN